MRPRVVLGVALLLLGVLLLLNQGESFGPGKIFAYFWPTLFVLPLSLFFHWLYFVPFRQQTAALLIPGGVFLTCAVVCQIAMPFNAWSYLWPGFILAPAVGLFEFYWFGGRNKWLLIPINILVVLSLLFFAVFIFAELAGKALLGQPYLAVLLIIGGAAVLIMRKKAG